mmetsp:Transcript_68736/g.177042  ORF Transcript_68736/g.177042 Transcript_68736/m.177042 type:complete len:242 (-) Transcript_68736:331-1056(-)
MQPCPAPPPNGGNRGCCSELAKPCLLVSLHKRGRNEHIRGFAHLPIAGVLVMHPPSRGNLGCSSRAGPHIFADQAPSQKRLDPQSRFSLSAEPNPCHQATHIAFQASECIALHHAPPPCPVATVHTCNEHLRIALLQEDMPQEPASRESLELDDLLERQHVLLLLVPRIEPCLDLPHRLGVPCDVPPLEQRAGVPLDLAGCRRVLLELSAAAGAALDALKGRHALPDSEASSIWGVHGVGM